jgi:hypothetical protein
MCRQFPARNLFLLSLRMEITWPYFQELGKILLSHFVLFIASKWFLLFFERLLMEGFAFIVDKGII